MQKWEYKTKSRIIITAIIIAASALAVSAQARKIKVDMSIVADAQLESEIQTYLTQQLTLLGNVEIVPKNHGDYWISVRTIKIAPKDSPGVRYVLSYELMYWVKCQDEVHLAVLDGALTIIDIDDLQKTLQRWVEKSFTRQGLEKIHAGQNRDALK
jgi:hypothetical protein